MLENTLTKRVEGSIPRALANMQHISIQEEIYDPQHTRVQPSWYSYNKLEILPQSNTTEGKQRTYMKNKKANHKNLADHKNKWLTTLVAHKMTNKVGTHCTHCMVQVSRAPNLNPLLMADLDPAIVEAPIFHVRVTLHYPLA